jgi:anti-anti-sigma regulatory factor
MTNNLVTDREPALLRLEGPLDISSAAALAAALQDRLSQALANPTGISVSLASVTALDVTCAQLLWAAGRDAQKAGVRFEFSGGPAPEIAARLHAAGLHLVRPPQPAAETAAETTPVSQPQI